MSLECRWKVVFLLALKLWTLGPASTVVTQYDIVFGIAEWLETDHPVILSFVCQVMSESNFEKMICTDLHTGLADES